MKQITIGIVGAKFAADFHFNSYLKVPGCNIKVKGITSKSRESREIFAHKYNLKCYENLEEMLNDKEIDVIDICVDNYLHKDFIIQSAEAGKNVICEKPLTGYFGEHWTGKTPIGEYVPREIMLKHAMKNVTEISESIKKNKIKFMYAENWVYAPAIQKINTLIQASIDSVNNQILRMYGEESHSGSHSEYYGDWTKSGGGALIGKGCHPLGGILYLKYQEGIKKTGKPYRPVKVSASIEKLYKTLPSNYFGKIRKEYKDIEDYCLMKIKFDDGSIAVIEASENVVGGVQNRLEVYTAYGLLQCNFSHNNSLKAYADFPEVWQNAYITEKIGTKSGWNFPSPDENWFNGYIQQFTDFTQCLMYNKEPQSGLLLAQDTIAIIYTGYLSASQSGVELLIL
ncbi:MAG: Gfo/Idh/MocA family oxidoreductase [bacterium]